MWSLSLFCSDALCQRTGSHSGAGLPPNVINLATVDHSGICEHRDKARLKGISTEVKSAGPCNMGAALGAGREVPGQDPSVDPKSSDTLFLSSLFCNILSYQSRQQNPNKSYFLISAITVLSWRQGQCPNWAKWHRGDKRITEEGGSNSLDPYYGL